MYSASGSDPIPLPPLDPDLTILFYSLSMKVSFSYVLLFSMSFEGASQYCRLDRQLASNHLPRLVLLFLVYFRSSFFILRLFPISFMMFGVIVDGPPAGPQATYDQSFWGFCFTLELFPFSLVIGVLSVNRRWGRWSAFNCFLRPV